MVVSLPSHTAEKNCETFTNSQENGLVCISDIHTLSCQKFYLLYLAGSGFSSPSYSGVPGSRVTVNGDLRPSEP